MAKFKFICLLPMLALTACVDESTLSANDLAIRQQNQAAMVAMSAALQQNTPAPIIIPAPVATPQIGTYGQPKSTILVQCKDLSDHVAACQVR